jgi:hypothetical protein
MNHVLVVGSGDMANRLTHLLAASGTVRRFTLVGRSSAVDEGAAALANSFDVTIRAERYDARDVMRMATTIRRAKPDLVLQTGALMSPWALSGRTDPLARGLAVAGLGVRLPLQMPVLRSVMQAVADAGFTGPVANLSLPDLNHPMLATVGLAPTVGLGNVAMYLLRVQAALRDELGPDTSMPLIRVAGMHNHVYDVFQARPRPVAGGGPWVWIGDEAVQRDELAYRGTPIAPGVVYNAITAASALPVLQALLPGGPTVRWSTPAPLGLLGGYPIRIADGVVALDLPDGVDLDACTAMCAVEGRGDGFERFDDRGYLHFSEQAHAALGHIAPELVEPLCLDDIDARGARLAKLLDLSI